MVILIEILSILMQKLFHSIQLTVAQNILNVNNPNFAKNLSGYDYGYTIIDINYAKKPITSGPEGCHSFKTSLL